MGTIKDDKPETQEETMLLMPLLLVFGHVITDGPAVEKHRDPHSQATVWDRPATKLHLMGCPGRLSWPPSGQGEKQSNDVETRRAPSRSDLVHEQFLRHVHNVMEAWYLPNDYALARLALAASNSRFHQLVIEAEFYIKNEFMQDSIRETGGTPGQWLDLFFTCEGPILPDMCPRPFEAAEVFWQDGFLPALIKLFPERLQMPAAGELDGSTSKLPPTPGSNNEDSRDSSGDPLIEHLAYNDKSDPVADLVEEKEEPKTDNDEDKGGSKQDNDKDRPKNDEDEEEPEPDNEKKPTTLDEDGEDGFMAVGTPVDGDDVPCPDTKIRSRKRKEANPLDHNGVCPEVPRLKKNGSSEEHDEQLDLIKCPPHMSRIRGASGIPTFTHSGICPTIPRFGASSGRRIDEGGHRPGNLSIMEHWAIGEEVDSEGGFRERPQSGEGMLSEKELMIRQNELRVWKQETFRTLFLGDADALWNLFREDMPTEDYYWEVREMYPPGKWTPPHN